MKTVLVTGGNTGIGLALCELLVEEHGCFVYLGSRNLDRGTQAVNSIKEKVNYQLTVESILTISSSVLTAFYTIQQVGSGKSDNIELVQIDVCSVESIAKAVDQLKAKDVTLFGLVNNAGVGLQTDNKPAKRVGLQSDRHTYTHRCGDLCRQPDRRSTMHAKIIINIYR